MIAHWGLLEPDAVKVASPVLRGRGRSNASPLPGKGEHNCGTLAPILLPEGCALTVCGITPRRTRTRVRHTGGTGPRAGRGGRVGLAGHETKTGTVLHYCTNADTETPLSAEIPREIASPRRRPPGGEAIRGQPCWMVDRNERQAAPPNDSSPACGALLSRTSRATSDVQRSSTHCAPFPLLADLRHAPVTWISEFIGPTF